MEEADGESKLELRAGRAGDRDLPLPSTRPPPSFRPDMATPVCRRHQVERKKPKESNVLLKTLGGSVSAIAGGQALKSRDRAVDKGVIVRTNLSLIASSIQNLGHDLIILCHYSPDMTHEYPPVEGGGSLILAWQIRNKRVLVVGGGEVLSLKFPAQV